MNKNKNMLLDTWEVSGTDLTQMYEVTKAIDDATKFIEMDTANIRLFTLKEITDTCVNGFLHGDNTIARTYELDDLKNKHGSTPELIQELENNSKMLFEFNGYVFYTTHDVIRTLCQRAGCRIGDADLRPEVNLRFFRNARFTLYMNLVNTRCHVIYREIDGAKKVIGVLSDRHAPISQTESISETIKYFENEMGEANLKWYRINSSETVLYVEFPEKKDDFTNVVKDNGTIMIPDEVIPGIMIRTADGGESSFTVIGTVRIGRNTVYVPSAKMARAHTKNADISGIMARLKATVFNEFTQIPERLCELLAIDVAFPDRAIDKVARYCNIKKALGLGTENDVISNIKESLNPNINYTAYDIAMMFLDEGTRLEGEKARDETIGKIRSCFALAVFFKYEAM